MSGNEIYPYIEKLKEIDKVNLWSYLTLCSSQFMCKKARATKRNEKREVEAKKRDLLETVVETSKVTFSSNKSLALNLLKNVEKGLVRSGFEVRVVKARLSSRGLFGGSETFGQTVFEVGLSFDPLLNLPFIPGSSLKGAVRSAYQELFLKKRVKDEKLCESECRRIFGESGKSVGLVGFTDAYPVEPGEKGLILYPDVMTPHYRENVKTELDVQPNPLVYLTVAPGTVFQFYVFWKSRGERRVKLGSGFEADLSPSPKPDLQTLALLDLALLYSLKTGVGAKTCLGYSSLEVVEYREVR